MAFVLPTVFYVRVAPMTNVLVAVSTRDANHRIAHSATKTRRVIGIGSVIAVAVRITSVNNRMFVEKRRLRLCLAPQQEKVALMITTVAITRLVITINAVYTDNANLVGKKLQILIKSRLRLPSRQHGKVAIMITTVAITRLVIIINAVGIENVNIVGEKLLQILIKSRLGLPSRQHGEVAIMITTVAITRLVIAINAVGIDNANIAWHPLLILVRRSLIS